MVKKLIAQFLQILQNLQTFQGDSPEKQKNRGVAQPGSALAWGARGRKFESCRPDQLFEERYQCRAGRPRSLYQ